MDNSFEELLLDGAYNGIFQIVKTCIDLSTNINTKDEYGDTALNKASSQGHDDIVKFLIEKGADINNKGGADLTPLMNAATAGHFKVVETLIATGVEINNDLLSVINMKVNILQENSESGMILPEGVAAWKQFLEYLINERKKQDSLKS